VIADEPVAETVLGNEATLVHVCCGTIVHVEAGTVATVATLDHYVVNDHGRVRDYLQ
jgi:hypothetical protein